MSDINIDFIKSNYDAVFFDMDGTIIDSMWIWNQVDIDYLNSINKSVHPNLKSDIEGLSYYQTAVYFKKYYEIKSSVEDIINIWDNMAHRIYSTDVKIKEGFNKLFNILEKAGIKIAVCTSNSRFLTETILKKFNYINKFQLVLTSDEIRTGKSDGTIYLTAASKLNVLPKRCLVFEDLLNGILAGKAADMDVCAVYDDFSSKYSEKKKEAADYYIESFNELFNEENK